MIKRTKQSLNTVLKPSAYAHTLPQAKPRWNPEVDGKNAKICKKQSNCKGGFGAQVAQVLSFEAKIVGYHSHVVLSAWIVTTRRPQVQAAHGHPSVHAPAKALFDQLACFETCAQPMRGIVFDTSRSCCLLILNFWENHHASFLHRSGCSKFFHALHDNITYSSSPMCLTAKQDLKPRLVSSQGFQNQYANLTFSTSIAVSHSKGGYLWKASSWPFGTLISPCGWCLLWFPVASRLDLVQELSASLSSKNWIKVWTPLRRHTAAFRLSTSQ